MDYVRQSVVNCSYTTLSAACRRPNTPHRLQCM